MFSPDKKFQDKGGWLFVPTLQLTDVVMTVFSRTKSGAALANEVVIHPAIPGLPVGGIGASGCEFTDRYGEVFSYIFPVDGYYAGKHAFEQFTHWRVSLDSPTW